jgi:hypothetical protein
MATKKLARAKKPSPASVKADASPEVPTVVASKVVWTLPIVMLMLIVAAGGLLIASRESSNAPAAATPAVTAAVMTPSATDGKKSTAVTASTSPETATAPAAAAPAAATAKPVSITGCLQRNDNGFVLKNTEGTAAPKARSWKSGFLKRSTSSVELTDTANAAHLASHVGQRVTVTGPLEDRDMRVVSLHRVAASCQ